MARRLAVVQSSYIPWKGYFDLIKSVDEFILLDDVQYTSRDWRNRNRIKTKDGLKWLTIPVIDGGRDMVVRAARIAGRVWARKHWTSIHHSYCRAPYFDLYRERFDGLYQEVSDADCLSIVNRRFIDAICAALGIRTKISWSTDHPHRNDRGERLVDLCRATGATEYLSGPTAKSYIGEEIFAAAGIRVSYADYSGYPEYPQLFPPFTHQVSILDLLFNVGPDAMRYMKSL